jgi:hypothetical protein
MLDAAKGGFFTACCVAKDLGDKGHEIITDKLEETKASTGQYAMEQIKENLEGSSIQVTEAPDVFVTILKVTMQDDVDVIDLLDFSLSGLRCRVKLEAKGTSAQLAGMLATGAAEKMISKAAALPGLGFVSVAADKVAEVKASLHASAASGAETKSVECDVDLDLGVRKGGDEVSAAVTICSEYVGVVDKVIPVSKAVAYIEEAIREKIQAAVKKWAQKKASSAVKGAVGEDAYYTGKAGVKGAMAAGEAAKDMVMGTGGK